MLSYSRVFSNYLQTYLPSTKGAKGDDVKGTCTGGTYFVGGICARNAYSVIVIYA